MIRIKLIEEGPQDRCFPRSHLSRQDNKSHTIVNAVEKMCEGLPVVLAQEDEAGVGSQIKRFFPKAMKLEVHK